MRFNANYEVQDPSLLRELLLQRGGALSEPQFSDTVWRQSVGQTGAGRCLNRNVRIVILPCSGHSLQGSHMATSTTGAHRPFPTEASHPT